MLMGFNEVVNVNGQDYHVQVEDLPSVTDTFEVRVYKGGGTLVFQKRISYVDKLVGAEGASRIEAARTAMQATLGLTKAAVLKGRIA